MAIYRISNEALTVKVNSLGAELCSVFSRSNSLEYIWQADNTIWPRHAPILFPVVGKLKNGCYMYNDAMFALSQHGFARDTEFICIENSQQKLSFELVASEQTLKIFPFHFSLQVTYTLSQENICVAYQVFNPDNVELYFSLGAHPAFNCPLQQNESFEDYLLHFENKEKLTVHAIHEGLISNTVNEIHLIENSLLLNADLFTNDALVLKNSQVQNVTLLSTKTGHGVKMGCVNWPYFGIWTKGGNLGFLCLEPWFGIADSVDATGNFSEKEGLIKLASESYFICNYELVFF